MDQHGLKWRNVLELSTSTYMNVQLLSTFGAIVSLNFIVTMTILVCYNLMLVSFEFLKWFYFLEVVIPILLLVMPLPIFFYRLRLFLIKKMGMMLIAPFSNVRFMDILLADMLTSMVKLTEVSIALLITTYHLMNEDELVDGAKDVA